MICALFSISNLTCLFSFCMVLHSGFREVFRPGKRRILFIGCLSVGCSIAGYLLATPNAAYIYDILDFISALIAFLAVPFLFRSPRILRALAVLVIYYSTIDTLWSFLSPFFHSSILPETVFDLTISSAVLFAAYKAADHKRLNIMAGVFHEIPIWMLVALFLFELTGYYKEFGISKAWYDVLYAISTSLIFISILYLVYRVFRLVYTQNALMKQLNDHLIRESDRIGSDESLRRFRHDFKNHATVINAMLEQGDYERAKRYFANISHNFTDSIVRYSTGSTVVDSLLNAKANAAGAEEIEIVFDGAIPEEEIEPIDMCICFSNLLDNAMEACARLPAGTERYIHIQSFVNDNLLVLSFENPVPPKIKGFSGAMPETTKRDIKAHGIGLKNVQDIANKYNGTLHLSVVQGKFYAELLLELRNDQS